MRRKVYIQDCSFIGFESRTPITTRGRRNAKDLFLCYQKRDKFKTAVRFERLAADPTCRVSVQVFQCKRLRLGFLKAVYWPVIDTERL